MKVLALDQDSYKIGWAIYLGEKLVKSGVVKFNGDLMERFCAIQKWTQKIIKTEKVEMVLYEDIFAKNMNTYKILSMLRCAIELILYKSGVDYCCITASTWKNGIHLKGKAREQQKLDSIEFALNHYKTTKKRGNDECDAICMGHYWVHRDKYNNSIDGWADI